MKEMHVTQIENNSHCICFAFISLSNLVLTRFQIIN